MQLFLVAMISLSTYIIGCHWEERTKQSQIAWDRSIDNLLLICTTSLFLPDPPTGTGTLAPLVCWTLLSEGLFTATHRMLHAPHLYKAIHKRHHENNPSSATACLDSHPVEFLLGNVSIVVLPMILVPGTRAVQLIWVFLAVANTIYAHGTRGPHMIHHSQFNVNYGQGFYLFDRMLGTYRS